MSHGWRAQSPKILSDVPAFASSICMLLLRSQFSASPKSIRIAKYKGSESERISMVTNKPLTK